LYEIKMCPQAYDNKIDIGGGDGSRTGCCCPLELS
jgi:hypothetical protein